MLFSVIIPLYNKEDTVERTLMSVCGQRFRDFEVIVVDDGSKDRSLDIVSRFADNHRETRIRILRKINGGVSSARNEGARRSTGNFLCFLDADDVWHEDFLKEVARVINRYPMAKVVSARTYKATGKRLRKFLFWRDISIWDFYKKWVYQICIHTSAFVVEREEFLRVGGYDVRYSMHEDDQLCFRLAECNKFYVCERDLTRYYKDAGERLTDRAVDIGKLPQYVYGEEKLQSNTASAPLRRCLTRWIRHVRDENVWHGNFEQNGEFSKKFPLLSSLVNMSSYSEARNVPFISRFCCFIRCAIWRMRYKIA